MIDANWQGNWRGCARRRVDGLVWLSSAGDVFVDTAECGSQLQRVSSSRSRRVQLTLRRSQCCTWCRPRASLGCSIVVAAAFLGRRRGGSSSQAWRAQRGRTGNKDGRFEANDLTLERNTPSATNGSELMDCRVTVLSGGLFANPISDDCGRQKDRQGCWWRCPMKNELEHREKVFQMRTAWNNVSNGVACGREVCKHCWRAAWSILSL